MELRDLGFDSWFQERAADPRQPARHIARVTAVDRGGGLVRNEEREVPAEPAGKLRFSAESSADLPCVGDWVLVRYHNAGASAIIGLPRRRGRC